MNTLAVVCFLAVVGCANCQISCYSCNSTLTPSCADPFSSGTSLQTSGNTCSGGACYKTVAQAGSSTVVTRSCVSGGAPAVCSPSLNIFGYGGTACACNSGNYCNAARPSVVPGALSAATVVVSVALLLVKLGA